MNQEEREKILFDPDYISSKRYKYSLKRFLKVHGHKESPDSMCASLLKMTVAEVNYHYQHAVATYQERLDL